MNWTETQQKDINFARRGILSLQDLEKEYGLPVATAMWKELDIEDADQPTEEARKAHAFGTGHGKTAAETMYDGNTTHEWYYKVFTGIAEGDPEIMDLEPNPLSGEWADGLSEKDVYDAAGVPPASEWSDPDEYGHVLAAFEDGFNTAFWDEVDRVCRLQLAGTELGNLAGIEANA